LVKNGLDFSNRIVPPFIKEKTLYRERGYGEPEMGKPVGGSNQSIHFINLITLYFVNSNVFYKVDRFINHHTNFDSSTPDITGIKSTLSIELPINILHKDPQGEF